MRFTKSGMEWIKSNGGPLLLIEKSYAPLWGGIDFSSGAEETAAQFGITDYDRACRRKTFLTCLKVAGHDAAVLGMPFFTAVWQRNPDDVWIIAVQYRDPDVDIHNLMGRMESKGLLDPSETDVITLDGGDIMVFDSAYPGSEVPESITLRVSPGRYGIEAAELREIGIGGAVYRFRKATLR
jgi:hypothetical protein